MRIGTGKDSAPGLSDFADFFMCWWKPNQPHDIYTLEGPATTTLKLRSLLGQRSESHWVQFLMVETEVTDAVQLRAPDIPNLGGPMLPGMADLRYPASDTSGPRIESIDSDDDNDANHDEQDEWTLTTLDST